MTTQRCGAEMPRHEGAVGGAQQQQPAVGAAVPAQVGHPLGAVGGAVDAAATPSTREGSQEMKDAGSNTSGPQRADTWAPPSASAWGPL